MADPKDPYIWLAQYDDGLFFETDHDFACAQPAHERGLDHGFACIDQDRLRSLSWGKVGEGGVFTHVLSITMKPGRKAILLRRHFHLDVLNGGDHLIVPILGFEEHVAERYVAKTFSAILPNGTIYTTNNLFDISWP